MNKTATVVLPEKCAYFAGRILTIAQVTTLYCYIQNSEIFDKRVCFDAGNFIGITFSKHNKKHMIWALDKSLKTGPEYNVNDSSELKEIVSNYLDQHPELGLSIENFV